MSMIPWRNKQCESEPTETSSLVGLRQEFDRLMERVVRDPLAAIEWPFAGGKPATPIDITEGADDVVVRAELPGVDPEGIDVTISGNRLTIAGEKKETVEEERRSYFHQETRYGSFRRTVTLPEGVDVDNVDARFDAGILTLRLPKSASTSAKKIAIQVADD